MARAPKPWYWNERESWFVTIDKQRYNLGPDKAAAIKRFHEMMAKPARRQFATGELITVIDAFLDWTQKHKAPDTYEWYRYRLERFARRYPDLSIGELKPFHIQEWADSYNLSVTSRRNYLRSVKRCLKWATRQGYIEHNPIADLEVPAAQSREVVISAEEFDHILSLAPNKAFRDLLLVTWESGCRPQESLRVEARHVDLKNRRWVFPKSESKNRQTARVVYLTNEAFEITQRQLECHPTGRLFRNSVGVPWTTSAVNDAFLRVRIRMGRQVMRDRKLVVADADLQEFSQTLKPERTVKGVVCKKSERELLQEARRKLTNRMAMSLAPNLSLYALRHSWATHALQRGVDPLTVSVLMGHRDPSTLAKVYQHLSQSPSYLLDQACKAVS